jgi:hypothetical protein
MSDAFRTPYRKYDVLDKRDTPSWNEQTRQVVGDRLARVPERRFFEPGERATLEAVCHRLLPQPDRPHDPVPIVPWIDRKLQENEGPGYRYENLPPLRWAWRLGLAGIDKESQLRQRSRFVDLDGEAQDAVLRAIQNGDVESDLWEELPPKRFFNSLLLDTVVGVYYAHPAAWSEIGYGGPASPRGYVRLGMDQRDPWEAEEER